MSNKNQTKLGYLTQLLNSYTLTNKMSPFPLYDTEVLELLRLRIEKMKKEEDETIECCADCKSLGLYDEEENKTWCIKCNSLNKIEVLPNYSYWHRQYGHIWI